MRPRPRDKLGRFVRVLQPAFEEVALLPITEPMANPPPHPSLRSLLRPARNAPHPAVATPHAEGAADFHVKPGYLTLLPHFHGMERENPYDHMRDFEEILGTLVNNPNQLESARLKLFPLSLRDGAKTWLNNLSSSTTRTWNDLQTEFLNKFFSQSKTKHLMNQIQTFKQKENETFTQYWERFKMLLHSVPHHGMENYQKIQCFLDGCTRESQQLLNTMCPNDFMGMAPDAAWDYLEKLADDVSTWVFEDQYDRGFQPTILSNPARTSSTEQKALGDMVNSLAKRMEKMELNRVNDVASVANVNEDCQICELTGH